MICLYSHWVHYNDTARLLEGWSMIDVLLIFKKWMHFLLQVTQVASRVDAQLISNTIQYNTKLYDNLGVNAN